jgi:hypothetical protein
LCIDKHYLTAVGSLFKYLSLFHGLMNHSNKLNHDGEEVIVEAKVEAVDATMARVRLGDLLARARYGG